MRMLYEKVGVRAVNGLHNSGLIPPDDDFAVDVLFKEKIKAAILDGRLKPGKNIRNYGIKSHIEVCKFVGMKPLPPLRREKVLVTEDCPKCHGSGKVSVHRYK